MLVLCLGFPAGLARMAPPALPPATSHLPPVTSRVCGTRTRASPLPLQA